MRAVPIIYKRAHWPAKAEYKVQEETELEDLLEILGLYVTTGGVRSGIDLVNCRTSLPQPRLVLDLASPGDARLG